MTERQMQTFFSKYVQKNPPTETEAYELKICKGTSLPFDSVQNHQKLALLKSEQELFFHKITDPPIFYGGQMRFNVPRPFDCFALVRVKAFVVIWFYKPRTPKVFYKIRIKDWIAEQNQSARKSITEEKAKEIGQPILIKIT